MGKSKKEKSEQQTGKKEKSEQQTGKNEKSEQQSGKNEKSEQQSGKKEKSEHQSGKKEKSEQQSGKKEKSEQQSGKKEKSEHQSGKKEKTEQQSGSGASSSVNGSYSYKMFNLFNRKFKISKVEPPADVVSAFNEIADGRDYIYADQLRKFLVERQREEGTTVEDAEAIVDEVIQRRHHLTGDNHRALNLDDFFYFLFADDLNGPIKTQVHHDMTAPMPNYFIFTGHNSYLTGNQLSSNCSEVPIIRALEKGVRVIELDLWPNSTKEDVHVLHGRTLTAPVSLIKCLKAIKEYAFVSSPYPVIITLEDHLTPELQAKVAEMTLQTFGDMLYTPESEFLKELPSPDALKHRILISTKPPREYLGGGTNSCEPSSSDDEATEEEIRPIMPLPDSYDKSHDEKEDNIESTSEISGKSGQFGEYKRLITIHAGKPTKAGIKDALTIGADKVRRLSLSEQGLEKAASSHGSDIVRFTQKNILRIYPKGTRFNSSNYNPMVGWMHGAQMIAFNMQGYGKHLWVMQGMFRTNGGCGYVKKPDFLMMRGPNCEVFDPKRQKLVLKTLKVKVYMGDGWRLDFSHTHFDTYSPPDFYTKVRIIGVPEDCAKRKTKIIEDDWCPVWEEEFTFPLRVPELALLRIEVREYDISDKDDFGGQTCLPLSELRLGFRAVALHDKKGKRIQHTRLLMKFEIGQK